MRFLRYAAEHWPMVLAVPISLSLIAIVVSLMVEPRYRANASFVIDSPESPNTFAGLAGVAGEFGIELGSGTAPPEYYASLASSRRIAEQLLLTRFKAPPETGADSIRLLEYLKHGTDRRSFSKAVQKIQESVDAGVDQKTGLVRVSFAANDPQIAADATNRVVELINSYNAEQRTSRAGAKRVFLEKRVAETAEQLRGSEKALEAFLARNRQFRGSPQLEAEHERLQRQVTLRQDIYINLLKEFESSRLREIDDTPVLSVVDRASPPVYRFYPRRRVLVIVAFLTGLALALVTLLISAAWSAMRMDEPEEYERLRRTLAALHLRRPRFVYASTADDGK